MIVSFSFVCVCPLVLYCLQFGEKFTVTGAIAGGSDRGDIFVL